MHDPVLGKEVDGYRIAEVLGRGGMGVVYKAEDVALSRTVAIKRINPQLANDEAFLRRFRSEARALARIDSAYIVSVHALRQTDIGLLIVMEFVDGGTVKDLVRKGPMAPADALPLIRQMLQALEHAHGAGVIHRDIKPHNIMLTEGGTVKVTDFGLAKVHRPDDQRTVTKGVYGTLNYMSPEQVRGGADLDHRSDLYSLGMTIYEMLTCALPFDEDASEFAKMRAIVEEEPPRPDQLQPSLPDALSQAVMKALAKDPADRFQSAAEMREAFEAVDVKTQSRGPSAPPGAAQHAGTGRRVGWGTLSGALALLVLLAAGGYFLYAQTSGAPGADAASEQRPVPARETKLTITTEPVGADVFSGDRLLGVTPVNRAVQGDSLTLRMQKAGYAPVDTTLYLGDATTASLAVALTEVAERTPSSAASTDRSASAPSRADAAASRDPAPSAASDPDPPPAQGTLTLRATPQGTVYVNGEARTSGSAIQVPAGTHRIRFRHPTYGTKDTTLTVAAGASQTLTCHFTHRVAVQSEPAWASVVINGETTGQQTPYSAELGAGATYRIEARRRGYTATGGVYRQRVGERRLAPQSFSGAVQTVTLAPSFEPEVHVIQFNVSESGS